MKHRIPAIGALAIALLVPSAFSQEQKTIEAKDKEGFGVGTDKEKLDDDASSAALPDQPKTKPAAAAEQVISIPDSVKNLTAEQRQTLQKLLYQASAYFDGGNRIQETFQKINEAEAITPDLFQFHNLKGAAYAKIRDFPKARLSFERALELYPTAFMSRFNITELDFVEHKFPKAEKEFKKLLDETPDMNLVTRRQIELKILIAQLSQDKDAEARVTLAKFNYLEDTPAYYFGKAAIAFDAEDEDEAGGWIRSAYRIYAEQELSVYVDSFIEMGWIENL